MNSNNSKARQYRKKHILEQQLNAIFSNSMINKNNINNTNNQPVKTFWYAWYVCDAPNCYAEYQKKETLDEHKLRDHLHNYNQLEVINVAKEA